LVKKREVVRTRNHEGNMKSESHLAPGQVRNMLIEPLGRGRMGPGREKAWNPLHMHKSQMGTYRTGEGGCRGKPTEPV